MKLERSVYIRKVVGLSRKSEHSEDYSGFCAKGASQPKADQPLAGATTSGGDLPLAEISNKIT